MHSQAEVSHNRIDPSSILFDKQGLVKLGVGNLIGQEQELTNTITSERQSLYEASTINSSAFMMKMSTHSDADRSELFAQDVFQLGIVLLISATGGMDLLNQDNMDTMSRDQCCVLHNIFSNEATMPLRLEQLLNE